MNYKVKLLLALVMFTHRSYCQIPDSTIKIECGYRPVPDSIFPLSNPPYNVGYC